MNTHFTQLDNGMRIVSEYMPHVDSVSLGIWLLKGSRHEKASENGMFHFIEHTLFKGTPTWSARKIAEAFDGIGGSLDAHTGKEETCYSFRLRAKHLDFGLEILADMLQHPVFASEDLDRERQVILEEIKMVGDDPEDLVFENAQQAFWQGHPLGQPILGTPELVKAFSTSQVKDFHRRHYRSEHMVVAAAGNLDHDHLVAKVGSLFGCIQRPASDMVNPGSVVMGQPFRTEIDRPHLEQTTFCLLYPGLPQSHENKVALSLLTTLLGGGMSSRLFQTIREEHGLAYQVGSFFGAYADSGYVAIYGSCSPENLPRVSDLVFQELDQLMQAAPDQVEVERACEQCVGGMVLALERCAARAGALAKSLHYDNRLFDLRAKIEAYQSVTAKGVQELAQLLFRHDHLGISLVGPLEKSPAGVMVPANSRKV